MARTCTRYNVGGAPTNDSGISVPTPAIFCAPTHIPAQISVPTKAPAPAQAFALTPAPASVLGPPRRYIDKDL